MKSKLIILAAMASVACTCLPLQAQQTQKQNRIEMLAILTASQCYVNTEKYTEERGTEILNQIIHDAPQLKAAYEWAMSSSNARAAVEAMLPYIDADCRDDNVTEEIIEKVLVPYLK
tara:strand:+ start:53 stop:403 length:351 start_codon:yes stop_codon:yes gene_type:complete